MFDASEYGFPLSDKAGDDLADITKKFNSDRGDEPTPFGNCGVMVERQVWTTKCKADYDGGYTTLGDILVTPGKVPDSFTLDADALLRDKGVNLSEGRQEGVAAGHRRLHLQVRGGGRHVP